MGEALISLVGVETWTGWGATSIILEEVAGNRNINTFGWYEVGNHTTLNEIFSGNWAYISAGQRKIMMVIKRNNCCSDRRAMNRISIILTELKSLF